MRSNTTSSKLLTLQTLAMIQDSQENYDGVILFTANGIVIGKLVNVSEYSDNISKSDPAAIVVKLKNEIIEQYEEQDPDIVFKGDGSVISVIDATYIFSNGNKLNSNYMTFFSDQIIGFVPTNLAEARKQYNL